MRIYADNAATTKMSRAAIEAMVPCLEEQYGNPSSLYALGQEAKEILEKARAEIAAVIHAEPREILITSGGSEADNQALRSAALAGKKAGKTHIISTAFEHHAIPVQPIPEIGALCREKGVTFHTDAVQAVGHLPIDVKAQNIDMLSASAHKFHGPKGIGFLYARKGVRLVNLIEGGAQEGGRRAGTENVASAVGMAAALKEAAAGMAANDARLRPLRDKLIASAPAGRPGHLRILR